MATQRGSETKLPSGARQADLQHASGEVGGSGFKLGWLHLKWIAAVLVLILAASVTALVLVTRERSAAESAINDFKTVTARIQTAEVNDDGQWLKVIWGYNDNTVIASAQLQSYADDTQYAEAQDVEVIYLENPDLLNNPLPDTTAYVKGQYGELAVERYDPWIVTLSSVAGGTLLCGAVLVSLIPLVRRRAQDAKTWG